MSIEQEDSFLRPYRSIGLFCDNNDLIINQTKDKQFLISSTNKSFKVYSLPNLQIKLNGIELEHKIKSIVGQNEVIFVSQKEEILKINYYHIVEKFKGHSSKINGMCLLENILLSYDISNKIIIREIFQYKQEQDNILQEIYLDFPIIQLIHPSTYINKVIIMGLSKLILLNIRTGKLIHSYKSILPLPLTTIQNSPVLNIIAIGYQDGTVQIFDVQQDKEVFQMKHQYKITCLSFSKQDRAMLAVGDNHGKITIWDLESRTIISRLQAHNQNITSLQFSCNNILYSSSGDDNHIIQWKYDELTAGFFYLLRERKGISHDVQKLKFMDYSGSDIIVSTNNHTPQLRNILINNQTFYQDYSNQTKKKDSSKFILSQITDFQFSFNNKFNHILCRYLNNKYYYIYDSQNKRIINKKQQVNDTALEKLIEQQEYIDQIFVTYCGNFGLIGYNSGLIIKINMQSNIVQNHKITSLTSVQLLVSDLSNKQIIAADENHLIAFDFLSLQKLNQIKTLGRIQKYTQSKSHELLLIAYESKQLILYNNNLEKCREFIGHKQMLNDLCFSENNKYIFSVSMDKQLIVWDVISQKKVNVLQFNKAIKSIDVSNDGQLIATVFVGSRQVDLWHNLIYMKPTIQQIIPVKFFTSQEHIYQHDHRIYHYNFDNKSKHQQDQIQDQLDQERLKQYLNLDIIHQRNDPHLIQFTTQQINKWMPLIDLDNIKAKNKIEIQEEMEVKIPFFLDFKNKDKIKKQFEKDKEEFKNQKSHILEKKKEQFMEELNNDLEQFINSNENIDGKQVFQFLKGLTPSEIDYQIRQHSFANTYKLLQLFNSWFDDLQEFDLKSTYLNVLLNTCYDNIINDQNCKQILKQIAEKEQNIRVQIQDNLNKSICLLEKFTNIKS